VLPAGAGVILGVMQLMPDTASAPRRRGGDPLRRLKKNLYVEVLPAGAGVILSIPRIYKL